MRLRTDGIGMGVVVIWHGEWFGWSLLKNAPPTATGTNFKLVQISLGPNLLTKCHDDRTINMASRVLTGEKMTRPLSGHVFPPTRTIFELIQDIIRTNHLTKFHNNRKINVAYRVLTMKNAPPPEINVASRVLTKFYYSHIRVLTRFYNSHFYKENAPPHGSHVFQANIIIFKPIQDINETNILTKFHEDWTINVASRVFTTKNAPPFGSHVFQANVTISAQKLPPPLGGHVFSLIWTIFELVQNINKTNANILTSKEIFFTAPPPGGHLHEDWTCTVFELSRGINVTNVLQNFNEDQTINVESRVFTRQNVDDIQRTKGNHKSSP
ncbi:hypothetical protein DPMN_174697 [Dreissena polymorpha]|uniref:Uncharacterized protein n=1 Tax=Dreissena polymorpha TaxID=45954 RepID=A0A9D4E5U7_DREPO|nr:hypothetical protein DPMN_174697 [Dreissena polymorpha]